MFRLLYSWRAGLAGCVVALLLRYRSYESDCASPQVPDVTAIVLNWSRFSNVVKIASTLCDPNLNTVVQNVTIWNNSPTPLSLADFTDAKCPGGKLHIFNSPANIYFQARYIACQQAATPYCFIQDDDYLILPEIIRTMGARIPQSAERGIHLLPAHEMLSSTLGQVRVAGTDVHTGFAWLGHGAMISRTRASEFLQLMNEYATDEQRKMADNYYTILANRIPEVWFDQGIALGGGEAFTVGSDGDERNERHIRQAVEMLEKILRTNATVPYVNRNPDPSSLGSVLIAPRRGDGLFETNIAVLPRSAGILDDSIRRQYLDHPPSHAVDGRTDTAFCPINGAQKGEYLLFDTIDGITPQRNTSLAFLVDLTGSAALRSSAFEGSADGMTWGSLRPSHLVCDPEHPVISPETPKETTKCSIFLGHVDIPGLRYLRGTLQANVNKLWCLYEIWIEEEVLS